MDADVLRSRDGPCQFTGLVAAQRLAPAGLPGTVVGRYEVLTYAGLSAPFLLSSPQGRSGLAPANLLLRMAGLAALTALFLVLGAARSHDTVPGATPRGHCGVR
ncbi:hypothetical protein [Blastococcus sp. PRF04-17]|uniref:hypothetical protein n=1 Tax=Blastococcus sp. PRF04-17 TaxID=2933797 RepID=UPI001FF5CF76|nr:hypothetical protein [Blastococcus sp. PRF04-17]UOY03208.1 hypothetical protein MVA48_07650 [Blastococcus sp. PRF04-17]